MLKLFGKIAVFFMQIHKRRVSPMSDTVRTPTQQRAIDKKNRIIEAGYKLFAEKGYFSTNTSEIAKQAGVSTGIVYGYFHDKRDILLEVLDAYIDNAFHPVFVAFESLQPPLDLLTLIPRIIDDTVETHRYNSAIHEALHALTPSDEIVNRRFLELEGEITKKIADKLLDLGLDRPFLTEKVHIAIEIVQSYAHECVYDQHSYIDYDAMRAIVIETLLRLFS